MPSLKFILALLLLFSTGPLGIYIAYRLARSARRPLSIEGQQAQVWKHTATAQELAILAEIEKCRQCPTYFAHKYYIVHGTLTGIDEIDPGPWGETTDEG